MNNAEWWQVRDARDEVMGFREINDRLGSQKGIFPPCASTGGSPGGTGPGLWLSGVTAE